MRENEIILYSTPEGSKKVGVLLHDENFWLTQKAIAQLFDVEVPAISKHLGNISIQVNWSGKQLFPFWKQFAGGQSQGQTKLEYYNLDAIIAVGYRVNSYQATQFRIWATKTLKEFIIKGFVLDDERLKKGSTSARIISTSFWNGFVKSGPASGDFTRRSPISMRFRQITIEALP